MRNLLMTCALGSLLLAGSARADDSPSPAPTVTTRPRVGLVAGGASLFGALYLTGVLGAVVAGPESSYEALYAPIVGPFVAAGHAFASANNAWAGGFFENTLGVLCVLNGLGQIGGVAMIVTGFAFPQKVERPVRVSPLVGRGMTGIGVTGVF